MITELLQELQQMQVVMRARASNEASEGAKNSDATVVVHLNEKMV